MGMSNQVLLQVLSPNAPLIAEKAEKKPRFKDIALPSS